jgi:DNA-binding HxlR family transcriptional regulator
MVSKVEHKHRTGCPVACSLDILGDHWTLLIVRNLMFLGLHEYKDMLQTEELISSNILTDRLKKLERAGLMASVPHPESGRRKLYYLTAMGKDLIHMMTNLVVWANQHLQECVRIPLEKKSLIEKDPDKFIRLILKELEQWETTYVK